MTVAAGERHLISSVALDSQDQDSPPQQLFYFLQAGPRLGSLQLKVSQNVSGRGSGSGTLTLAPPPADSEWLDAAPVAGS